MDRRLGIVHYNTFYLLSKMTEQSFEIVQVCVVERDVVVIGEIVKPEHGCHRQMTNLSASEIDS